MSGILANRRILVVEDEMLVLMNIEMILEDLGCVSICTAARVAEALDLIKDTRFDAAILDVNLDGERSYPVADLLVRRSVPFAFSTGYGDHGDRADFHDRPVLRKPYLQARFAAVLEELLTDAPLLTAIRQAPV